jgi:enediyne biosynthesis protein E2
MSTTLGSLRRLVLTPSLGDVTFARRGFPVAPSAAASPVVARLEAIPQSVICGFEWGIDDRDQWEIERRLELVEPELRGFAYEGATMASTIRDAMAAGRGHRTRDLLSGPGRPHLFLAYIGIGFAMARLPRALWRGVLPDLDSPYHPTMSWLAVDGYGFDRAYFDTDKWVTRQWRPPAYPWLGRADYFPRAVDQGIGRALWFIHGGRATDVAAAVGRFAADRRADLWSGVGLASTVAGGCPADGLRWLCRAAGEHQPHLAQGAVFGAKARASAGFVPAHTHTAVEVFADRPVGAAAALADDLTVGRAGDDADYETWRARIRAATTAIGAVA